MLTVRVNAAAGGGGMNGSGLERARRVGQESGMQMRKPGPFAPLRAALVCLGQVRHHPEALLPRRSP